MENCSSIIVLDKNSNSIEIIKSYLNELGLNLQVEYFEDYKQGLDKIKSLDTPPIVIADISEKTTILQDKLEDIRLFTTKIVITSTDYSTDTIVRAMRLGAREFLPKPIIKEDLKRVLILLMQQESEVEDSASRIITVY